MEERRKSRRDKVILGGIATLGERGLTRNCLVKNISDAGAGLEFGSAIGLPNEIVLTVAKKARTYPAEVAWQRGNTVGVRFRDDRHMSDLGERLRRSERKKRELQSKIRMLLGEG